MHLSEIIDRMTIVKLKIERIGESHLEEEYKEYEIAINEFEKKGIKIKDEWFSRLYETNRKIWDLESDIRKGKENELGLEEVGRRAIEIRNINQQRVSIKNQITEETGSGFKDIKMNHASAE